MTSQERINKINELLSRDFPSVETPLTHSNVFTLTVAVALSAQTLDATVNKVTPALWEKYPTIEALASADVYDVEALIKLVNFYKTKAKNIVLLSQVLLNNFNGIVPHTIEELIMLPGVGRKTANVVINAWFAKGKDPNVEGILPEGFVVDTHVARVAKRLGLTKETTPEKIEKDLMKIFPRKEWDDISLRMIFHGRTMCTARNPKCRLDPEWSKICTCVKLSL